MKLLITGSAGFIGFHLANHLLKQNNEVVGIDNINNYYDPELKKTRTHKLQKFPTFVFQQIDIADKSNVNQLFQKHNFDAVIHLAAQAGVRYSIEQPEAYIQSNLVGFANILEACRNFSIKHFIFASSSSVYGNCETAPFNEQQRVDHPVSLYAATKKSNELLAYSYAHLYQLPCTGLRFFTVYGPWGRRDMAYFKFTQKILSGKSIDIYHNGNLQRDFTYIDDIVDGIIRVLPGNHLKNKKVSPYEIYNIGNDHPVKLLDFIELLENALGKKAQKNYLPMQAGDVFMTHADISRIRNDLGYQPKTSLAEGLQHFTNWYRQYYSTVI